MKSKFSFSMLSVFILFSLMNISKAFSQIGLSDHEELFKRWVLYPEDLNQSTCNQDTCKYIPHDSPLLDNAPLNIKHSGITFLKNQTITYQHWRKCGNEPITEPEEVKWRITEFEDKPILSIIAKNSKTDYYIAALDVRKLVLIKIK